jgi:tetratricopeptide (TPR) repeat protein
MKQRIILILVIVAVLALIAGGIFLYLRHKNPDKIYARAQVAMRAENWNKAAELADEYIEKKPDDWKGYFLLAQAHARLGRYEEARSNLQTLLDRQQTLNPDDRFAVLVLMADTYAFPARESLDSIQKTIREAKEFTTPIQALRTAVEQFEKANQILAQVETSKPLSDPNDLQQAIALNFSSMAEFDFLIAGRYGKEAQIAKDAGEEELSKEKQKLFQEASQKKKEHLQEAIRGFLQIVSRDPTRKVAAQRLTQLSIEQADAESLAAARKAILEAENADPVAKTMLWMYEMPITFEQFDLGQVLSQTQTTKIHQIAQKLNDLLKQNPDELQVAIPCAKLSFMLSDFPTTQRLVELILQNNPHHLEARLLEAKIMLARGETVEAERKLFSLKADFPLSPQAHLAFAEAALAAGKKELARQTMRRITERKLDPGNPKARRFLAESLLREGFFDQAFMDARVYFKNHPEDPIALGLYVDTAVRTKQLEEALQALKQTREKYAADPVLMAEAAKWYGVMGNQEEMRATARLAAESAPTTLQARLAVAQALVMLDRTAEAEKLLTDELAREPQHPQVNFDLGKIFARAGRNIQALERFYEAVRWDDDNEPYRLALAQVLFNLGEMNECQTVLNKISETNTQANFLRLQIQIFLGKPIRYYDALKPTDTSGSLNLAITYLQANQPKQCLAVCEKELEAKPDDMKFLTLNGQAYLMLGDNEKCYDQWVKLLQHAPNHLSHYFRLAQLLISDHSVDQVVNRLAGIPDTNPVQIEFTKGWLWERSGNLNEALNVYTGLSNRAGVSGYVKYQAGLARAGVLSQQGQRKPALDVLDTLNAPPFYKNRNEILKVQLLITEQRFSEADKLLQKVRTEAIDQRDTAVLRQIAQSYAAMKKIDLALSLCDDVELLKPNDPESYLQRASILVLADQREKAVDYYRKAINCQPGRLGIYVKLARIYDNWQEPLKALAILEELENLNQSSRSFFERGILFNHWGLYAQAVECFEQLAALGQGENPAIRLYLGQTLKRLGSNEKAKQTLEEIPSFAPEYSSAQLLLANLADTTEEKLNILKQLQTANVKKANVLVAYMNELNDAGRADEALAAFRAFLESFPENNPLPASVHRPVLEAIALTDDTSAACVLAQKLARRKHPQGWHLVAALLIDQNQPQTAAEMLPKEFDKSSLHEAVLGVVFTRKIDQPDEARKWMNRLQQLDEQWKKMNPPQRVPSSYRILASLSVGDTTAAKTELEQFRNPIIVKSAAAELVASVAANTKQAPAEVQELLKVSLALDLMPPALVSKWAWNVLQNRPSCQWAANLILASKTNQDDLQRLHKILEPKDCLLTQVIEAELLMKTSQYKLAAQTYQRLVQQYPDEPYLYSQLGLALEKAEMVDAALKIYQQVWQSTKNPFAANNAAYLVCELFPQDNNKLHEAKEWIDAAYVATRFPELLDTRGWIAYRQGNYVQAHNDLCRAVKYFPNSPEVHYHLGEVVNARNQTDLARWHLAAAVQLGQIRQNQGVVLTQAETNAVKRAQEALKEFSPDG